MKLLSIITSFILFLSVVVNAQTNSVPMAQNLVATAISPTQIKLVWTVTFVTNKDTQKNFIYRRANKWNPWVKITSTKAWNTTYTDSTCLPNSYYQYMVKISY